MAEDQTITPTTEEKNFESSPVETTPVIPSSTTSKDDIPVPEEKSKSPSAEKASSISRESAKGFKESSDQSTGTPISSDVAPMEPQEREAIENMLSITVEGIIGNESSTMPESQGEETQSLVREGAMVLFEQPALEETTGTPLDGPDPSPEETCQESSSQVSFDPTPSPHFDTEPLEVVAPVMRSSDEEDEDDVALSALIVARRLVATPELLSDLPQVDEEATEEPSSLIKRSQKKKHSTESTSKEVVGTPSEKSVKDSGKLKKVMVEESLLMRMCK
ncbi:PREDICTED: endochitinase A-like [Nicotiana attenuata]|uniref:endochitinase A-like n=1 Tax=Nicotiana attenuata TaxID=49451 RepID=UPI0009059D99|nr:PREDICTED: endochitinase A-like [Nicotiana attenuata]